MGELQKLRNRIDEIDYQIIELLSKRNYISKEVGEYKRKHNLDGEDIKRFDSMLFNRISYADDLGIDSLFIKRLFSVVHANSLDIIKSV